MVRSNVGGEWNYIFWEAFSEHYKGPGPRIEHLKKCKEIFRKGIEGSVLEDAYQCVSPHSENPEEKDLAARIRKMITLTIADYSEKYEPVNSEK